ARLRGVDPHGGRLIHPRRQRGRRRTLDSRAQVRPEALADDLVQTAGRGGGGPATDDGPVRAAPYEKGDGGPLATLLEPGSDERGQVVLAGQVGILPGAFIMRERRHGS